MRERITITASAPSTFVMRDIDLLSDRYDVTVSLLPARMGAQVLTRTTRMFWNVLRSKAVLSWFADASYHPARFCRFLGRKQVVVLAGYDVAAIPEIGYGALNDPRTKERVRWVLSNASKVVAVDQGLIEDLRRHFGEDFGAVVLPTGYDTQEYRPSGQKERMVISVCSADGRKGLVKGIDVFAECARRMPEIPFVLIGVKEGALPFLGAIPENLEIIEHLPAQDIIPYYQRAKVYCQLSMREGLPNAVCEAMLCGCAVVGSDVQGIRTAIGEHGLLVPYGDAEAACEAIGKALSSGDLGGREHIMANFTLQARRERLLMILSELTDG